LIIIFYFSVPRFLQYLPHGALGLFFPTLSLAELNGELFEQNPKFSKLFILGAKSSFLGGSQMLVGSPSRLLELNSVLSSFVHIFDNLSGLGLGGKELNLFKESPEISFFFSLLPSSSDKLDKKLDSSPALSSSF
jgi:hypothetical protein